MAVNWQDALSGAAGGALSGGATGAAYGAAGGPIGTAGGAGIGALLGLLASVLSGGGKPGQFQQAPISGQQQSIFDLLLKQGQKNLENPYEGFEPIKQSALSTFFQDIVPGLQEQFNSRGSNSFSSGALQSQLGGAGATLAQRLSGMQSQFGQQNQANGLNQISLGLTPLNQNYYQQRQPGFGENLLSGTLQAAPYAIQGYQQNQQLQQLLAAINSGK